VARGSLTIVGTGIEVPGHITEQTRAFLESSDEVLYLVAEPVAAEWIERVNPKARSLHKLYRAGRERAEIYEDIVEALLAPVRAGRSVCGAFYGHPGVYVNPSHDAIRRARAEGFEARMLPGVSADACLFADLGVDPSDNGCQSYEATDLLLYRRTIEPSAALVVWQAGAVGNLAFAPDGDTARMPLLVEYLRRWYPAEHPVVLYEASAYAVVGARSERVPLSGLADAQVAPVTTLYLEPLPSRPSAEMAERLGLQDVVADETTRSADAAATSLPFAS
jgi:precorrin-3B methylase